MIRCKNCFREYDENLGLCPFCGYFEGEQAREVFCLSPGTTINGRYIIGEMLGLGGFGITYKAWDAKLGIEIAVKEYYPSGLVNRQPGETRVMLVATKREREFVYGKTRFLEEARNMAKFSAHKNIVNVFDFFESNNTAYIVMEFLDGRTLSQVLQQQNVPLPYDYCVSVATHVCAALKAIHKEKILHRDVSPDNIMICSDGNVKLFDFGAARFSAGVENRVTVIVKPGFAPPEQYDKVNRQDARTDVYALGATLYYAMTGIKPEESTNRKIEDKLLEPSSIDNNIPANISNAIMRAMSLEQQYRFPDVNDFEVALTSGRRVSSVQKERAKRKRRRFFGILTSLVLVVTAASLFYYIYDKKTEPLLPDANLSVWYIQTGDEQIDRAKAKALEKILQNFTEANNNISCELLPINHEDYESLLTDAVNRGEAPSVFESTGLDNLDAISLSEELDKLLDASYYIPQLSPESQYPTGIIVPIIYVNSTMGTVGKFESIEQILDACKENDGDVEVKKESAGMYAAIYGDEIVSYATEKSLDDFLSRDVFIFLGDSSDYFTIQESLAGEYALFMPGTDIATYRYGSAWSVSKSDEDEETSAMALIAYFNTPFAQGSMHIENRCNDLPITRESLTTFITDIYGELEPIDEYLSRPFVKPEERIDFSMSKDGGTALDELKPAPSFSFEDIPADEWYAEAVYAICELGIMDGTGTSTFEPYSTISKADVLVSLYRLAGAPHVESLAPFSDIDVSSEEATAVSWAYENGIVSGSAGGPFRGERPINLETLGVIFYRYAAHSGLDITSDVDLSLYADSYEISDWAVEAIRWGISHEIFTAQNSGVIAPKDEVSRARFAIFLQRMMANF